MPPNMPSGENTPPTMLSEENTWLYIRNNTPLETSVTLSEGWVTNLVNMPLAPCLSEQDRVDYIKICADQLCCGRSEEYEGNDGG